MDLSSRRTACVSAVAILAAVIILDVVTGDLSFVVWYLVPIAFAVRRIGRPFGLFAAIASSISWSMANRAEIAALSLLPALWNISEKLLIFSAAAIFIARLQESNERERALARTDHLTGAVNRICFMEVADLEMARSSRAGTPFSVAYLDADNFKRVNDTMGHAAGDALLCDAVRTIRTTIRKIDVVARLGGDEFALLLPGTDCTHAESALARLKARLTEAMSAKGYPVTFSVGLVTFETVPDSVDTMLSLCDELMYSVKNSGKNAIRHECFKRTAV